jgi:dinuclear metal center YbgI/SA1388 family protein
MFAKGQTIIQFLERFAPKAYAVPDDKIGLQLGSLQKDVGKVLVALDVTEEVVQEAVREQAGLIVAHHAIIYRPLAHLRTDTPAGRLYEKLIKEDIAVYIAHTNLDTAEGGVNDWLAAPLGLEKLQILDELHEDALKKLVVFVPEGHEDQVRQAMFAAGAGHIGQYSSCSFNIAGTGTFLPQEGTTPFIGSPGRLERVREVRIETIVPGSLERKVVQAMLKAHPYEEAAYDLYPLDLPGKRIGLGRVGTLAEAVTLDELVRRTKAAYDVPMVRVVGDLQRPVRKVAVLGGSGSRYVSRALHAGADVLITGDIDYHTAHDALAAGIALIDPGHNVEKVMKAGVADYLNTALREGGYETTAVASQVNTEPFQFR